MDQEIKTTHYFLEDSTQIGNDIHFILSVYHSKNQNLFFPKVNETLGNFEIKQKTYFSTKTSVGGISKDSIVYTLNLFSNQKINYLELPIYASNGIDCTKIELIQDSIILQSSLKGNYLNKTAFFESIQIEPLGTRINYPKIIGMGIGLILGLALVFIALKKPILRYYTLFRLWREHRKFSRYFDRELESLLKEKSQSTLVANLFLNWKKYMENLVDLPITSYTTKEIIEELRLNRRKKNLTSIDAAIYGGIFDDACIEDLQFLNNLASETYAKKIDFIKKSK